MQVLPSWLTTVLLALLLTFISYKLITRGFITWHSESLAQQHQRLDVDGQDDGLEQPLLQDGGTESPTEGERGFAGQVLRGGGA